MLFTIRNNGLYNKSMTKIFHECVDCTDFTTMQTGSLCTRLYHFNFIENQ